MPPWQLEYREDEPMPHAYALERPKVSPRERQFTKYFGIFLGALVIAFGGWAFAQLGQCSTKEIVDKYQTAAVARAYEEKNAEAHTEIHNELRSTKAVLTLIQSQNSAVLEALRVPVDDDGKPIRKHKRPER